MSVQAPPHAFQLGCGPEDRLSPAIGFLVSHGVGIETLRTAERLALATGVTPDVALLRSGLLDEDIFYRALARQIGVPFRGRDIEVHPMSRYPEAVLTGLVPLAGGDGDPQSFGYAPTGESVLRLLDSPGEMVAGFCLTSRSAIQEKVLQARARSITARAADGLPFSAPHLSFRGGLTIRQAGFLCGVSLAAEALFTQFPTETWLAATMAFAIVLLATTALRLAAVLEAAPTAPAGRLSGAADRDLPVYTILVPLHREARVVPKLIRALSALDYPGPKLDVKLIVEADDAGTQAALREADLPGFMEVIVAPPGEPRTKPRALNVALPLARGSLLAVYDAEDVPDPGQLRLAVSLFSRAEPDVACLQARLVIDNAADTWLTRFFAIEYATLFDVVNPALVTFDLPVPLGGTSNHFRTDILKGLGGWDAWNVTEDADLGMRLAAAGYRVGDLPSKTLEEAPRHLGPWMRQRSRWMKGFLQVSVTHSRRPLQSLRQLGPARLMGATTVTLGTVLSAFGYPIFTVLAVAALVDGRIFSPSSVGELVVASIGTTLFCAGLAALVVPPIAAIVRRRWWWLRPMAPLMPLYYVLVSIAAWRGLLELVLAPARWNKTEHGLARTSLADPRPCSWGASGLSCDRISVGQPAN